MKNEIKNNPIRFAFTAGALLLDVVALIVYLCTGIIHNFTEVYSISCIIFAVIAIVAGGVTLWKRIHLLETVPFIAMTVALILFIVVNLNYIVAVVRAIDVTSVSPAFAITVVLMALGSILAIVPLCLKTKKE